MAHTHTKNTSPNGAFNDTILWFYIVWPARPLSPHQIIMNLSIVNRRGEWGLAGQTRFYKASACTLALPLGLAPVDFPLVLFGFTEAVVDS